MPYITSERRSDFKPLIAEAVKAITSGNETHFVKGEYFGFVANRIIKTFLQTNDAPAHSFNSNTFNEKSRKALVTVADKLAGSVAKGDIISGADELNYVVTSLALGILGAAEGMEKANYGTIAYHIGMLEHIRDNVEKSVFNQLDTAQRIMNFRRMLVTKSVINDIVDEIFRRVLIPQEEAKKAANGDLWENGQPN